MAGSFAHFSPPWRRWPGSWSSSASACTPHLVYSHPLPEHSLTAFNAASSRKTLGIMLTIALLGIPVVLAYSASIYWIFRGKVKLDRMSY